jgi:hypothetical protein
MVPSTFTPQVSYQPALTERYWSAEDLTAWASGAGEPPSSCSLPPELAASVEGGRIMGEVQQASTVGRSKGSRFIGTLVERQLLKTQRPRRNQTT